MKIKLTFLLTISLLSIFTSCGNNKNNSSEKKAPVTRIYSLSGKRIIDISDKSLVENEIREAFSSANERKVLSLMNKVDSFNYQYSTGHTILSLASYFLMDRVVYKVLDSDFVVDSGDDIFEQNPIALLIKGTDIGEVYESSDRFVRFKTILRLLKNRGYKIDQNVKDGDFEGSKSPHTTFFWTSFNGHYELGIELLKSKRALVNGSDISDNWRRELSIYTASIKDSKYNSINPDILDEFILELTSRVELSETYFETAIESKTNYDYYLIVREMLTDSTYTSDEYVLSRSRKLIKEMDQLILKD